MFQRSWFSKTLQSIRSPCLVFVTEKLYVLNKGPTTAK